MLGQKEAFKYAQEYLNQLKSQNKDFVIDGDTTQIGDVDLSVIMDMDFEEDLKNELVTVHATDYSPSKNNAIVSTESTFKTVNNLAGTHDSHRITVHTTLNSLVQNNNGGEWDYRLFTILEPFSNINSEVCGFGVSDTFFANKVDLSDKGIVLVREADKDKLSSKDKEMNIVYFRGNPRNAVNKVMIMMGYKPQTLDIDDIKNEKNNQRIKEFRISQGYGPSRHSRTVYSLVEGRMGMRDILISSLRGLNINTCLDSRVSLEEIMEILKSQRLSSLFSEKMDMVRIFLEMGIAFHENGPYLLNSAETIKRISKYYNHENFEMLITEETIRNFPEIVDLLNQYQALITQKEQERLIDESYQEALSTNNILNLFPQYVDHSVFTKNDYIRQYSSNLKSLFKDAPFAIKITELGAVLTSLDDDIPIFTTDLFPEKSTDKEADEFGIDNIKIDFDFQKSLIENLQALPGKISEIYQKLNQKNEIQMIQVGEDSNTGFHI